MIAVSERERILFKSLQNAILTFGINDGVPNS